MENRSASGDRVCGGKAWEARHARFALRGSGTEAILLAFFMTAKQTRAMRTSLFAVSIVALPLVVLGDARGIASRAFPSVVMLVTEDPRGQPLAIGSGFFVREDVIASNAHVIEGA